VQVPAFCRRQVLINSCPGSISVSSGTLTSSTNLAISVQELEVGVAGPVEVGAGVEVLVGCTVCVAVGGTWLLVGVVCSEDWVLVGTTGEVGIFAVGEAPWVGVATSALGILHADTSRVNNIKMDILRSVRRFILFPSGSFNLIIGRNQIVEYAGIDVNYTWIVPGRFAYR
jgi:hypothetical protein